MGAGGTRTPGFAAKEYAHLSPVGCRGNGPAVVVRLLTDDPPAANKVQCMTVTPRLQGRGCGLDSAKVAENRACMHRAVIFSQKNNSLCACMTWALWRSAIYARRVSCKIQDMGISWLYGLRAQISVGPAPYHRVCVCARCRWVRCSMAIQPFSIINWCAPPRLAARPLAFNRFPSVLPLGFARIR